MLWNDGDDDDDGKKKKEEEVDLEKIGDYDLGEDIGVQAGEGQPPEEKNIT